MLADAPQGLCPACLLNLGVVGQTEVLDSKAALEADPTLDVPPDAPATSSAGDLANLFPQIEILGQLGSGGMGAVYKARQKQLDRIVALKLMHPRFSRDPQFAERFNREARALAKLSHPNIVHVYEFGAVGVAGAEQFYFIMEYVDGANLQQMIGTKTLSAEQALAIVPKLCDALQYAHDEGVVHRDIKPANILMDKKGRVKIADFGLAKIAGVEDGRLTRTNQGMGTMMYMAPEQMENAKSVDHRADIYSLGVVFYEMLTGELPMGHFAPPSEKVQVDVRFDEIVLHAMERDADRRYQHVSEVKTAVENVTSTPGGANAEKPAAVAEPPAVRRARASWLGRRSDLFRTCAPLALLALVIGMACFVLQIRIVDGNTLYGNYLGWPSPWLEATRSISKGVMSDVTVQVHPFTLSFFFVMLILINPFVMQYCERVDSLVRYGRRFWDIVPVVRWRALKQVGLLLAVTILGPILVGTGASYAVPTHTTQTAESRLWPKSKAYEQLILVLPFYSDRFEGAQHYRRPNEWHLKLAVKLKSEQEPPLMEIDMPSLKTSYFLPKWSVDTPRTVVLDLDELTTWLRERCNIDVTDAAVQKEAAEVMALLKQFCRQAPANFDEYEVAREAQLKSFSFGGFFMNFDFDHALTHEVGTSLWAALIFMIFYIILAYRIKHAAFALDREVRERGEGILVRKKLPRVNFAALPPDLRRRTLWLRAFALVAFLGLAAGGLWWGTLPPRMTETTHYQFVPDSKDFRELTLTCTFERYVRGDETYLVNPSTLPMKLAFTRPDGVTRALTVELPGMRATWKAVNGGGTSGVVLDTEELARWMREELYSLFTPVPETATLNGDAADVIAFLKNYSTLAPTTAEAFRGALHKLNHFKLESTTIDTYGYMPFSRVALVALLALCACLPLAFHLLKRAAVSAAVRRNPELYAPGATKATPFSQRDSLAYSALGVLALAADGLILAFVLEALFVVARPPTAAHSPDGAEAAQPPAIPRLGPLHGPGIGLEFTVPAGQVAILELVTLQNGATIPIPSHCAYIIAADKPSPATFRWTPETKPSNAPSKQWKMELVTLGGSASSGGLLLPDSLESWGGGLSGGASLSPNDEYLNWIGLEAVKLPANGGIGLRIRTVAHNTSEVGFGVATTDWQKGMKAQKRPTAADSPETNTHF
jgi:serine/threonine protein kinase